MLVVPSPSPYPSHDTMNALLLCLVGLAGASAYAAPSAYQHQLSWEEAYGHD